ncbi:MAG: MFS transporter [Chloroflexota bacterium]|nr:MFS transporter [Chloroflexota bacterium]
MLNILLNVVIPVVILTRFSDEDQLGPVRGFILALAFPLLFGLYELWRVRRFSFTAGLGIAGVLLTGGIGLFELDPKWVAVKEAAVPLILALAIIASQWTPKPLARLFLEKAIDTPKVRAELDRNGTAARYERLTVYATYLLASAFFLSAALNYILAKVIVTSEPGTAAFNRELGRMTALSFPVITIPVMIVLIGTILFIVRGTQKLTGLGFEEIFQSRQAAPKQTPAASPD